MSCSQFRVENPLVREVFGADWGSPVRFDREKNCFWVNGDMLTPEHFALGKIEVNVKTKDSRSGKYEDETWEKITLDIRRMPVALRGNFRREIQKIDPKGAIVQSYTTLFQQYQSAFQAVVQLVRGLPAPQLKERGDSQFAQFYAGDSVEKDVTFCCDDGEVKAHKFVLISKSPSWKAHFIGAADSVIQIEGVGRATIEKLVEYLYTGSIRITDDREAFQLYKLADLYQIVPLKTLCEGGFRNESLRFLDASQLLSPDALRARLEGIGEEEGGALFLDCIQRVSNLKRDLEIFHETL